MGTLRLLPRPGIDRMPRASVSALSKFVPPRGHGRLRGEGGEEGRLFAEARGERVDAIEEERGDPVEVKPVVEGREVEHRRVREHALEED